MALRHQRKQGFAPKVGNFCRLGGISWRFLARPIVGPIGHDDRPIKATGFGSGGRHRAADSGTVSTRVGWTEVQRSCVNTVVARGRIDGGCRPTRGFSVPIVGLLGQ